MPVLCGRYLLRSRGEDFARKTGKCNTESERKCLNNWGLCYHDSLSTNPSRTMRCMQCTVILIIIIINHSACISTA